MQSGTAKKADRQWLDELSVRAASNSIEDASLYAKYDVKRGLRDVNGKGVLAGLTKIGDVLPHWPPEDPEGPGKLIYRGMDVRELVKGFWEEGRFGFEETCYLLLAGTLPDRAELERFGRRLAADRALPDGFVHGSILTLASRDVMNAMAQSVLALYVLDAKADDTSVANVLRQSLRLIAQFPLIAAYSYQAMSHRYKGGTLSIRPPKAELSTAENFLHCLKGPGKWTALEARLLDLALVLHAEHGGGNNSTFTTHVVTSSGTDTYSVVAAALGSLKGPRHGGANIKVVQMFDDLKRHVKDWESDAAVADYLERVLRKEAFDRSGLVYGVGHAVYSSSDPRAVLLRDAVGRLAEERGLDAEMALCRRVERLAPEVIAKSRRMFKGLSVNIDFYSGMLYRMLRIPEELYTPLFAMARIAGWSAHRIEELANGGKIIRPAYKSVARRTAYVPLAERKVAPVRVEKKGSGLFGRIFRGGAVSQASP